MKYVVKFFLLDGRGDSRQHFTEKENAKEFYDWCKSNPRLVINAIMTQDTLLPSGGEE